MQREAGRQTVGSELTRLPGDPRLLPLPSWLPPTRDARQPEAHTVSLPCSYGVQKHTWELAGENFGNFIV